MLALPRSVTISLAWLPLVTLCCTCLYCAVAGADAAEDGACGEGKEGPELACAEERFGDIRDLHSKPNLQ